MPASLNRCVHVCVVRRRPPSTGWATEFAEQQQQQQQQAAGAGGQGAWAEQFAEEQRPGAAWASEFATENGAGVDQRARCAPAR